MRTAMPPRYYSSILLILTFLLLTINIAKASSATIAVASNFLLPMQALANEFLQETKNTIKISSGSTGKLYAQIVQGAPYDVFFAANQREPERLETEGVAISGTRFTYAIGQLVLWSRDQDLLKNMSVDKLKQIKLESVSIANPNTAPYGAAAQNVITKLYKENVPFRIIRGENIGQAYQYAYSGNVQAGFVALSQVLNDGVLKQGSMWNIQQEYYPPILQQAVLLKHGKDNQVAKMFLGFVQNEKRRQLISEKYGYQVENLKTVTK